MTYKQKKIFFVSRNFFLLLLQHDFIIYVLLLSDKNITVLCMNIKHTI
jgi:hypothetical protein